MLFFAMMIYILTACLCLIIGYEFKMATNGTNEDLRKSLIILFWGMAFGIMLRGVWGMFDIQMRVDLNPYVSLLAIVITFLSVLKFYFSIMKYHRKK